MEIENLIQLINGVGFPIVVSIALFYTNTKQDERYRNTLNDLAKVIENNTKTLAELNANCNTRNGRN